MRNKSCRVRHHDEDLSDPALAVSPTAPSLDLLVRPLRPIRHGRINCTTAACFAPRQLECGVAGLQGRGDQLEEANKQFTEQRDQFLERYYRLRLVRSRPRGHHGCDRILRGWPDKHDQHETPSLPAAKQLHIVNGQLEDGIAKITATLGGEHRSAAD